LRANQSLIFLPNDVFLSDNTNFIVIGLTRLGFELTIYRIRDEHASHYSGDALFNFGWQIDNNNNNN
jgi:hypothetical protein